MLAWYGNRYHVGDALQMREDRTPYDHKNTGDCPEYRTKRSRLADDDSDQKQSQHGTSEDAGEFPPNIKHRFLSDHQQTRERTNGAEKHGRVARDAQQPRVVDRPAVQPLVEVNSKHGCRDIDARIERAHAGRHHSSDDESGESGR